MFSVRDDVARGPVRTGIRNEQGLAGEVLVGERLLSALSPAYDDLAKAVGLPVTNRRAWLEVWWRANMESEPWGVLVWRGERLEAAALLSRRWRGGAVEIVGLGHGRNDRSRLPARSPEAAEVLADVLVDALVALELPWELRVEQLPVGCPAATRLAAALPGGQLLTGGNVPCVRFEGERVLDAHLSKNLRRQLRKCRNRMADDDVRTEIGYVRDRAELRVVLDEVEAVHRGRDHAVGRRSDIDDPTGLALWRGAILRHIELDEVEIATLRIGGELAAYVVSLLDGDTYRVLDGRFDTAWERYSPGRILETATLGHAMEDRRYASLDWMNSVAPDKLIAANAAESTVHLVAGSTSEPVVELTSLDATPAWSGLVA